MSTNSTSTYFRLLKYGKAYWLAFTLAIVGNLLNSSIDAYYVYLLKPLTDKGFIDKDVAFLFWIPFIILGLFIARACAAFMGNYFMGWVSRHVVMAFRQDIFKHLLSVPSRYYDKSTSGQLLSLIVYNTTQVASACTDALSDMAEAGFLVMSLLIVMFSISWQLSLLFFIAAPFIAFFVKLTSARQRRLSHGIQHSMADITHVAEEVIEGYKVVRIFGGEDYETKKFQQCTKRNVQQELKLVVTKSLSVSGVQFLGACVLSAMVVFATGTGRLALTAGEFAAMMAAMMALLKPMKQLTKVNAKIQRGIAGAESIFTFLDEAVEKDTGTHPLHRAQGKITFDNVCFSYTGNTPVLSNISFSVKPGEVIALVGRSGSGKSSLVSLLPRFYDVQSGSIYIDDNNIKAIALRDLRNQFAYVSQHITLFNDTIANNMAYGLFDRAVTKEELISAASAAHALEFIEALPEGFDTMVGENGVLLSGGQRQRLAIARALLKDAPFLILDEATSALDTESERHIQDALALVMRSRTTLVIAHRLSTIEKVDRIIVLDAGKIIEMGDHSTLLNKAGAYAKLHQMQFQR
ncbi:MAG: lipid A export permease/ATP-binding protein MsbA [Gammaproteobacteria bacterium]